MSNLTCAQIVADALAIAKCPGFTAQGGRALNFVLNDLSLNRNLKQNLVTETINAQANSNGPFDLDRNYLRTFDMVFYVTGEPYFLNPGTLKQYDSEIQQNNSSTYPYEWASDLSQVSYGGVGKLYIYPQSNVDIVLTHRFYLLQYDITNPETSALVPWFNDQDYIINAVAMRMMRITDDSRYPEFVAMCEKMLESHLMTEGDEQQVVKEVQLDPRRAQVVRVNRHHRSGQPQRRHAHLHLQVHLRVV